MGSISPCWKNRMKSKISWEKWAACHPVMKPIVEESNCLKKFLGRKHLCTWPSWANVSLVHSVHANTCSPFTRIVVTKCPSLRLGFHHPPQRIRALVVAIWGFTTHPQGSATFLSGNPKFEEWSETDCKKINLGENGQYFFLLWSQNLKFEKSEKGKNGQHFVLLRSQNAKNLMK